MVFKNNYKNNSAGKFFCQQRETGFSLIEVMITIALIGIISAIAYPNYLSWVSNSRLKAGARELYGNMQKARLEAVKRNSNVAITFNTVAFPAVGGSYTVFVDDGDGAGGVAGDAVQNGTEATLYQVNMPAGCSLSSASFLGNPRTGFTSQALPLGNRVGTVQMRNKTSQWYQITLMNSGHVKLFYSSDGAVWN